MNEDLYAAMAAAVGRRNKATNAIKKWTKLQAEAEADMANLSFELAATDVEDDEPEQEAGPIAASVPSVAPFSAPVQ